MFLFLFCHYNSHLATLQFSSAILECPKCYKGHTQENIHGRYIGLLFISSSSLKAFLVCLWVRWTVMSHWWAHSFYKEDAAGLKEAGSKVPFSTCLNSVLLYSSRGKKALFLAWKCKQPRATCFFSCSYCICSCLLLASACRMCSCCYLVFHSYILGLPFYLASEMGGWMLDGLQLGI